MNGASTNHVSVVPPRPGQEADQVLEEVTSLDTNTGNIQVETRRLLQHADGWRGSGVRGQSSSRAHSPLLGFHAPVSLTQVTWSSLLQRVHVHVCTCVFLDLLHGEDQNVLAVKPEHLLGPKICSRFQVRDWVCVQGEGPVSPHKDTNMQI